MNPDMILANPVVTLGCVTLGAIIIALTIQRWWKKGSGGKGKGDDAGHRQWTQLLPFFLALCYGMLVVLASPGVSVLGTVSKLGLWGGNVLGYGYLVWGIGGTDTPVTRAHPVLLTPGGYAILGIWTALVIGQHMWSKRLPRLQSTLGTVAGILIGMSAGVAGVAAVPLASGVNILGAWYAGFAQ